MCATQIRQERLAGDWGYKKKPGNKKMSGPWNRNSDYGRKEAMRYVKSESLALKAKNIFRTG
jgi:hypothetical protein